MKPSEEIDWSITDRFRSNDGTGPLTARILSVSRGIVRMERWRNDPKKTVRFELSERFFLSPRCGWRKVNEAE